MGSLEWDGEALALPLHRWLLTFVTGITGRLWGLPGMALEMQLELRKGYGAGSITVQGLGKCTAWMKGQIIQRLGIDMLPNFNFRGLTPEPWIWPREVESR